HQVGALAHRGHQRQAAGPAQLHHALPWPAALRTDREEEGGVGRPLPQARLRRREADGRPPLGARGLLTGQAAALAAALGAAALAALLVQSARGLRAARAALEKARAELAAQRAQVAHLTRVAMLGELSCSVAHELNQPLTAIMSNAQAGLRFLARGECDLEEVRGILTDV